MKKNNNEGSPRQNKHGKPTKTVFCDYYISKKEQMQKRENEPVSNLVVEGCEDEEGSQAGGGQRVEGLEGDRLHGFYHHQRDLEEQEEVEVCGNPLEARAQGGDGQEPARPYHSLALSKIALFVVVKTRRLNESI